MMLQARDCLGPYEIVALIGAGGMGEVYRTRATRLVGGCPLRRSVAQGEHPIADFLPDGRRIVFVGAVPGRPQRT